MESMTKLNVVGALALLARGVLAQNCISLAGSTACPAFTSASISTDSSLVGLYPFLAYVSSTEDFDNQLNQYVDQQYVQSKYVNLFGCNNVNLGNTSSYYARYTTSFICNGIIQNSRQPCQLSAADSQPLCADSCADLALSEEQIVSSSLCSGRNNGYADQLRADFTNCALPASSISGSCISGEANEPDDCGFANNLMGLCNFCRASTVNGTDSCCVTSNSTGRCQDVTLPVFSTIANLFSSSTSSATTSPTSSPTSSSTAAAAASHHGGGLSGGAIAGIVVGSILGFLLLCALIVLCFICLRRRKNGSKAGSLLNQPSPQRKGVNSSAYNQPMTQQGYEVLPGGRVARMSALQDDGVGGGPVVGPRNYTSHTDPYGDSPESRGKVLGAAPAVKARGSPGTDSQHGSSPGDFSSPEGVASGQSEQLPFFKDYYSTDDIHPGDRVSCLWAYQPRAGDEFELERGDMLKVVGIWDDGWATGVRIDDRAEDYDAKHKMQRDSGVSNGSTAKEESPTPAGEIKAFPLVCVCLPEAWKKTVEGDSSTDGSGGPPPI